MFLSCPEFISFWSTHISEILDPHVIGRFLQMLQLKYPCWMSFRFFILAYAFSEKDKFSKVKISFISPENLMLNEYLG